MTELAVVIPTYKQKYLIKTLEGLALQENKDFEILVVENGIHSQITKNLCLNFKKTLKIEYIFEVKAGANRARNIGVNNCFADVIGLIDDDCVPNKKWTKSIKELHSKYPNSGIIGGKVILKFFDSKPDWLEGIFRSYLAELDWGDKDYEIHDYQYLVGANFSFNRNVFSKIGGFDETVGLKFDNLFANDEIDFITNTRKLGKEIIYSPQMLVKHLIPQERTTLQYLLKKSYSQGIADAFLLRKSNPNYEIEDAISFLDTVILEDDIEKSHITELKLQINRPAFLIYIEYYIQSKIQYFNGLVEEIQSNKKYYTDITIKFSTMHDQYKRKLENIRKMALYDSDFRNDIK